MLAFATYQKKPEGCDKKYLAKKGLEATRVDVPATKSCKIWLIHRIEGAEDIDMELAATLCWAAVRGFTLGPFQQHMTRYQLELAQCNGNMGMALVRTFVDSYAIQHYASPLGCFLGLCVLCGSPLSTFCLHAHNARCNAGTFSISTQTVKMHFRKDCSDQ